MADRHKSHPQAPLYGPGGASSTSVVTQLKQYESVLSIGWSQLTSVPTTISGYGITDAYTDAEVDALLADKADVGDSYTKAEADALLADKADAATTLAGYNIGDAYTQAEADNRNLLAPALVMQLTAAQEPADDVVTRTGATFARASTATLVDAAGTIQSVAADTLRRSYVADESGVLVPTYLVESVRTNALNKSADLSGTSNNVGGESVSLDATTAPDGTLTADKIIEGTATGLHSRQRALPALAANTTQPFTLFAKLADAGRAWAVIRTDDKAGVGRRSWIDLTTGTPGTVDAGHTIHVTACTDGWYRIACLFDSGTGASTARVYLGFAPADGNGSWLGNGVSGGYTWGWQFETDQPDPTSYIPTTDTAATRATDTLTLPLPAGLVGQSVARYQRYYDLATQQWVEAVDTITATATLTLDVDRAYRDVLISDNPATTLAEFQRYLDVPSLQAKAPLLLCNPVETSAALRFPIHGEDPTTIEDGDMWVTADGLFVRIGGETKQVTFTA